MGMNLSQVPESTIHTDSELGLCSPDTDTLFSHLKARLKPHLRWEGSHLSKKYACVIVNAHLLI